MPSKMSGSGREAFRMSGSGREACRMSGSGRKAIPNVREWSGGHLHVREWSVGPSGCPGVVGRPSQMFGSGQVALTGVREY